MEPVCVWPVRPEHLNGIIALERATPEAPHWTEAMYAEYFQESEGALQRKVLLATGTSAHPDGFIAASLAAGEAELESIVVASSARRSGVGAKLLGLVCQWAREHGARTLLLEVRASNQAARTFYAAFGFRFGGVRPGYYKDPVEEAVLLRLDLDQVGATTQPPEPVEL